MAKKAGDTDHMAPNHEVAESVIDSLRENSPYLLDIQNQLLMGIDNLCDITHAGLEVSLLERVKKLVPLISGLPVSEYGRLIGTFNTLRKEHSDEPATDVLVRLSRQTKDEVTRKFLRELKTIFDGANEIINMEKGDVPSSASLISRFLGRSGHKPKQQSNNMALAADALVLLRTVYPAGVNMLSPDWTGNYYCDATSVVEINKLAPRGSGSKQTFIPRDIIKIEPYGEEASMITYEHMERAVESAFPIIIRDGESILIGRSLGIRGIFGVEHPRVALLRVSIKGVIHDSSVSRAGLLVYRFQGKVYVFNRGSMNNYQITEENASLKSVTSFAGTCIEKADGFYEFGTVQKTQVVPNQAHLQIPQRPQRKKDPLSMQDDDSVDAHEDEYSYSKVLSLDEEDGTVSDTLSARGMNIAENDAVEELVFNDDDDSEIEFDDPEDVKTVIKTTEFSAMEDDDLVFSEPKDLHNMIQSTEFSTIDADDIEDSQIIQTNLNEGSESESFETIDDLEASAINTLVSPLMPDQYEHVSDIEFADQESGSFEAAENSPPSALGPDAQTMPGVSSDTRIPKVRGKRRYTPTSTRLQDAMTMPGTTSRVDILDEDSIEQAAQELLSEEDTMPGLSKVSELMDEIDTEEEDNLPPARIDMKANRTQVLTYDDELVQQVRQEHQGQEQEKQVKEPKRIRSDTLNIPIQDELESLRDDMAAGPEDKTVAATRQELLGDALKEKERKVHSETPHHAGFTQAGIERPDLSGIGDLDEDDEEDDVDPSQKISLKFGGLIDKNDPD